MTALEPKLTVRQLAERWGLSIDAIYRLVKHPDPAKRLPHLVLHNRTVYFEPSELATWVAAQRRHRTPAAPQDERPAPAPSAVPRHGRYRE